MYNVKSFFLLSLLCISTLLVGCEDAQKIALDGISGQTMGTSYSILWPATVSVDKDALKLKVEQTLSNVNQQMSTYDPASELSLFNQQAAPYRTSISSDFVHVMTLSQEISALTEGYFDVTVGPLVNLWGFGPDKQPLEIPPKDMIEQKRSLVGYKALSLESNVLAKSKQRYVDLSAIAKGYGVDKVAETLDSFGVTAYLVEIGGELRAKGVKGPDKPWIVAVERPQIHERAAQLILPLKDTAMATSGDYRNFFYMDGKRLSHSIDPFTGEPTAHTLASVTVVDENCARADALATAMLVMGAKKAKELADKQNIAALLIERGNNEEFKEIKTPAWNRRFDP